jgi:hypothetical protein
MPRRPARTWTILVTLVVLAGLLVPAVTSAPLTPRRITAQPATLSFFGLNGYFSGYERPWAEVTTLLPMGPAIGMHWTREEVTWANVEPAQDSFNFDHYDTLFGSIADAGYGIIGMLVTTPAWARKSYCAGSYWCGPANVWDFYDFAFRMVERYDGDGVNDAPGSPRVAYWEIWNEPNFPTTWPGTSEVDRQTTYGDLLHTGYQAVKAADPTAQVLVGSLYVWDGASYPPPVYDGLAWLGQVQLRHPDICADFDILAIHPHMPDVAPDQPGLDHRITMMGRIENALAWDTEPLHLCDGERPVFVTEAAWSTCTGCGGWSKTEDQQANYLVRTFALAAARGVSHVNVFQLEDKFDGGASDTWGNCAIVKTAAQGYAPKKAYQALGVLTDQVEGFTAVTPGAHNSEPDRFDYRFTLADGTLVDILWRANEANETINFAVEPGRTVSWVSRDGVVTPLTPVGGTVSFTINGYPGYLRQEASPVLALSTNVARWITLPGETPHPHLVYLTNAGGGTLNWTATLLSGSEYFTVEPISGTAPATLTIRATPPLDYGYYTGEIYVDGGTAGAASIWLGLTTVPTLWKTHLPLVAADR